MKKPFLPVQKIIVATIVGISFASMFVPKPTLADFNQPFGSPDSNQNTNPLSGNGSDFNMFNLIHQANFGTIQWNDDEQNQQLDQAAAAFKAEQNQRFQPQNKQTPAAPEMTSGKSVLPLQIRLSPSPDK